jgi:2-keto-3-deoxy-L-rhamnonate aldolase RhmA
MSPFDWAVIDIKHGPRGTRQKNIQNLESVQSELDPRGFGSCM